MTLSYVNLCNEKQGVTYVTVVYDYRNAAFCKAQVPKAKLAGVEQILTCQADMFVCMARLQLDSQICTE